MKSKERIAREKQLEFLKANLSENGYKACLAKLVTLSPEYFRNGGNFNWADYKHIA
jgi:hypothetical protein